MQRRNTDWRTILLIIGAAAGAMLAFAITAIMITLSAFGLPDRTIVGASTRSALDVAVLATVLVVVGAVFLPSIYYGIRRLLGHAARPADQGVLRIWQGVLLVVIWLAAAFGAGFLSDKPVAKWITPLLFVLAIGIPVYFFARLATGGLHFGSRQRMWGVLAAGIGLGITPAIVAELLLALLGVIGLGVYIGLHPEQLAGLQDLARQLQNTNDLEHIMDLVGPWLQSPVAFIAALVFFSGFSPLIEETTKSLTAWTIFDRLSGPAQGFAVGAISGAAFGLVESLLVSATPDASWAMTLLVRGASTMMHIMAASLTGWGIGQFRVTRSFARLLGMYLLAIGLHGLWNASVVAITFASLRSVGAGGRPDVTSALLIFVGAAVLVMLCLAIPVAIGLINWRFRRRAQAAVVPAAAPVLPAAVAPALATSDAPWALEPDRSKDETAQRGTTEDADPHETQGDNNGQA